MPKFDDLQIGGNQDEAERFASWLNTKLQVQPVNLLTDNDLDDLWDQTAEYFALYDEARCFARALLNRSGVDYQLNLIRRLADSLLDIKLAVSSGSLDSIAVLLPTLKEALGYLAGQEIKKETIDLGETCVDQDLEIADLSHLSDEQFNALCPQGFHGVGDD